MKNYFSIACIIAYMLFSCNNENDEIIYERDDFNVPSLQAKEFGQTVAQQVRDIVMAMYKDNIEINYAETEKFEANIQEYASNFINTKSRGFLEKNFFPEDSESISLSFNNLTDKQKEVLFLISETQKNSTSAEQFFNGLQEINKFIEKNVPEFEQERLFMVTSVLYYSITEITTLMYEGFLPDFNSGPKMILTRAEESSGNINTWCASGVGVVWLAAAVEPTPFGELVATGYTMYVGGKLLYEFLVRCFAGSGDINLTPRECWELTIECYESHYIADYKCTECLRWCEGQGVWKCPRPH